MKKIVTFGEIMLRLSKPGLQRLVQGDRFQGFFGGSESNAAISLSVLGDDVEFVTRVPANDIGRAALMHLMQYGVSIRHVIKGGDRLGSYYFEAAAAMRNSRVVYDRKDSAFQTLKPEMIDWPRILSDAWLFHCSGITSAISEDAMHTTFAGLRTARELGKQVFCDINYRKNLWKYGRAAQDVLPEMVRTADYVFGDQGEWEVVTGMKAIPYEPKDEHFVIDREAYLAYFRKAAAMYPNVKRMILAVRYQLTSSHHILSGLLYDTQADMLYTTRLYDYDPVVDPMGCGDAFCAALIHAFTRWDDNLQYCLDFSLSAGALKNTIPGDQNLATEDEIISNMKGKGGRIER